MSDEIFVTRDGDELTTPEAIQMLMRRNRELETRLGELSDLVNLLIGRIHLLEREIGN